MCQYKKNVLTMQGSFHCKFKIHENLKIIHGKKELES